ncbi:MAG TPA: MATE family efflux transporter [Longimicrobiales bacterium]|nr:MATE family efflux transporter [Longimicrobiales bacterium]
MKRAHLLFVHELRGLGLLAGPIIVNQLGHIGMNTADTIMVGPLGAESLAATGLGGALQHFVLYLATGVVMGMAPLVSQSYGAGDQGECRRVYVQGSWLAIALSIPVALFCLAGGSTATLLGQDPAVVALTGGYMRALALGILPALLFVATRQYLEGMGHTTAPMVVTFLGLGLNIVANQALIHGVGDWIPALGVVGTGWATTLVRTAMFLAIFIFLAAHRSLYPLHDVRIRPERGRMRRILRIGGPVGAQFGLEVGLFSLAAVMMGLLGAVELAAHQVTISIAATTFMFGLGASIAGSIRVGHHIGAGRTRAVRRAVVATYLMSVGLMLCCAIAFILAPRFLLGLYTPHRDVIDVGVPLILVAAAFQLFDGAQVAGMCVLRGAADTRGPMLIAALGYWCIGLPIGYVLAFGRGMGPVGVWIGLSAGLAAVALLLVVRVRRVLWSGNIQRDATQVALVGG